MKPSILLVTSNFPRWEGDSTTPFVLHLAQHVQETGWRVDVLAPHAEGAERTEMLEGIRVERFRYMWPASQQTVCYQGGALINLRDRPSNKAKLPMLVAAEWGAVLRRIRARRYDLVNSHWILPQGFVGALTARPMHVPHVITVHGGDIFALRGGLMRAFKRYALHRADTVTVNSSVTRKAVLETAPRTDPIEVIPMGVSLDAAPDPAAVTEVRERHRRGDGPLLAFVGRVVEEKGVEDVVRAVGLLRERLPDTTAVIIGEGQHRPTLERLATELGLSDAVTFLGWVAPADVPAHLAAADALLAPSRQAPDGWIEAQGLSVLEAMSAGTPVVATRSGGVVDAVRHEETGLLVSERAPGEIADAVGRLVREDGLASRLVEAGSRLVEDRFSQRASAAAFAALFDRLVSERRTA